MIAQLDSLYIRTSPRKTIIRLLSYLFFEGRPLTTKGQWINPFVLGLFSSLKRLPQIKKVHKPIFIIGTGRSGTTILGTLLSMHREVGYLNEPKALWHSIYPEEDLAGSYCRGIAKYRLKPNDAPPHVIQVANKLFGSYLGIVAAKRVVDKYPELVFRIPFVRTLFPDAKFIFLVRNGWDTCQSIEKWSEDLGVEVGTEQHDWWGRDNRKWKLLWDQIICTDPEFEEVSQKRLDLENPRDMATLEWIVSMREGLRLKNEFPEEIHIVHYEELVSQPQACLTKILNFCELSDDKRFFQYASQRLNKTPPKNPFVIHPSLQTHFEKIMRDLGYSLNDV